MSKSNEMKLLPIDKRFLLWCDSHEDSIPRRFLQSMDRMINARVMQWDDDNNELNFTKKGQQILQQLRAEKMSNRKRPPMDPKMMEKHYAELIILNFSITGDIRDMITALMQDNPKAAVRVLDQMTKRIERVVVSQAKDLGYHKEMKQSVGEEIVSGLNSLHEHLKGKMGGTIARVSAELRRKK